MDGNMMLVEGHKGLKITIFEKRVLTIRRQKRSKLNV